MNHYPHHIGDFNNATRHLTRVERALYRDLIDVYYDTEQALPGDDFEALARRILARGDDEKSALKVILGEFFTLENGRYHNARCDREILKYQQLRLNASKAGQASAQSRLNGGSTRVKRPPNKRTTNQNQNQNQLNPLPPGAAEIGITEESWTGFYEMRREIKKPMTERAVTMMVKQLGKLAGEGWNPNELLDNSTRNSWLDMYPDKVPKTGSNVRKLVL